MKQINEIETLEDLLSLKIFNTYEYEEEHDSLTVHETSEHFVYKDNIISSYYKCKQDYSEWIGFKNVKFKKDNYYIICCDVAYKIS